MSMANEMRVKVAARKDMREAKSVTVMCCESPRSKAINETPHAISSNVKENRGSTWSAAIGKGGAEQRTYQQDERRDRGSKRIRCKPCCSRCFEWIANNRGLCVWR